MKTTDQIMQALNVASTLAGVQCPFGEGTVFTNHPQFGGDYEGETLVKAYQSGKPSFMAMLRPVGGAFECVTFKRDALDLI